MSKVKVAVRVRPMNKRETAMNAGCVVDMEGNQTFLTPPDGGHKKSKTFAFDHCFWSVDPDNPKFSGQEFVFDQLGADVLENAFSGYNACIFAYGQTGSGKSYTMMGSLTEDSLKGIIPRLCDTMFDRIAEGKMANSRMSYKVEVAYMEIYCEKVRDLLCPKGGKHSLKVREHKSLGPYVEGLSKLAVTSFIDINEVMSEGNKSRTVAATQMNAESSRSHAVFSIVITQTEFDPKSQLGMEKVAKMSLVDLAGSERAGKTGALGDRLKEGSNINKSLTTLGLVISSLADMSSGKKGKTSFVPYRDSILTWLLKDNLGGNSKTVMIATVSPASDNYEESLSTLRYADRAKRIVNHAVVNEDKNSRVIRELREEVEKLRQMLEISGGAGAGGEGAGAGGLGSSSTREMTELQEKLRISESLMQEMTMTWEQRVKATERIHQERQKALENMGISIQEAGIGVRSDKYYLVNLNADPSMNELLVCYLKEVTRIGRPEAD
ncbi:Kinesin-like protein KIF13A, partial [Geodia barretti]